MKVGYLTDIFLLKNFKNIVNEISRENIISSVVGPNWKYIRLLHSIP